MSTERGADALQEVIDGVYDDIRRANAQLAGLDAEYRIVEAIEVRQVHPDREVEPPTPTAQNTGNVCGSCGQAALIRTGTCETCTACGATGGCG